MRVRIGVREVSFRSLHRRPFNGIQGDSGPQDGFGRGILRRGREKDEELEEWEREIKAEGRRVVGGIFFFLFPQPNIGGTEEVRRRKERQTKEGESKGIL